MISPPPPLAASSSSLSAQQPSALLQQPAESENQVSSSSPNFHESGPALVSEEDEDRQPRPAPKDETARVSVQTPNKLLKGLILESSSSSKNQSAAVQEAVKATEKKFKQYIEKMRSDFDQEKKRAVNVATRSLERDLERLKADHSSEVDELNEKHKEQVSANKKKQWCYHCEAEAIYWCCWNTAYCSTECQQKHWHSEHKRACRRKR